MGESQGYIVPDELAKIIKPMPAGLIRLITLKQLNTQAYWERPVITGARPSACPCCGAVHPLAAHGVCGGCYEPTIKKGLFGPALLDHLAKRAKCGKKIRPSGPKAISGEKEYAMHPALATVLRPMSQAEAETATIAGLANFWRRPLIRHTGPSACPCCGGVHRLKNGGICSGCNSDKVAKLNLSGLQLLEHLARRAAGGKKTTPASSEKTIKKSISPAPESSSPAATPLAGAGQVECKDKEMALHMIVQAIQISLGLSPLLPMTEIPKHIDKLLINLTEREEECRLFEEKYGSVADVLGACAADNLINVAEQRTAKVAELTQEVASLNRVLAGVPSHNPEAEPWKTCETILQLLGLGNGSVLSCLKDAADLGLMTAGLIRSAICDGILRIEDGSLRSDPIQTQELTDQDIVAKWSALPTPNGYESLAAVLHDAMDQAAHGKGLERHADDRPFHDQPLLRETQAVGLGFPAGQARKKILEAVHCCDDHPERAVADLLGAINYTAALVIAIRSMMVKQAAA